jgi:hypothetical protein
LTAWSMVGDGSSRAIDQSLPPISTPIAGRDIPLLHHGSLSNGFDDRHHVRRVLGCCGPAHRCGGDTCLIDLWATQNDATRFCSL